MFFCRQLHVLLLSIVAAAAVVVLSICVDVLSGKEVLLGQRMLYQMIGTTAVC